MENTQKTPEQWFQMLKEPYRSEAINNLVDNRPVLSLNSALECQKAWDLTPQRFEYWNKIAVSIKAGETTYLETEPIELRPEDLEEGETYTLTVNSDKTVKYTFCYDRFDKELDRIYYSSFYGHKYANPRFNNYMDYDPGDDNIRLATPEEAASLLKSEPTDWEAMYNELKAKFDQLEQKGEKVYFYFNRDMEKIEIANSLDEAKVNSEECHPIYEAVKIGVKKSVLVNEL